MAEIVISCSSGWAVKNRSIRDRQPPVKSRIWRHRRPCQVMLPQLLAARLSIFTLRVGFNTPAIIRWPFERITAQHPHAALIRINLEDACVPSEITEKSIAFKQDIAKVIQALVDRDSGSRTCLSGRSRPS